MNRAGLSTFPTPALVVHGSEAFCEAKHCLFGVIGHGEVAVYSSTPATRKKVYRPGLKW